MAPAGAYTRANGEHVLVHRCLTCDVERHNRIAADDDFELGLGLPSGTPRKTGRVRSTGSSEESA